MAPFEILTAGGGLLDGRIPFAAILRDYHTKERLPKTGLRLFVCGTIRELSVVRTFGLAAMPMKGLREMNARRLRELTKTLGWEDGTSSLATGPIRLILVNCKRLLVDAVERPEIRQLAHFLARVDESLGIDMSRAAVWTPDEHELAKFRFCLEREDLIAAREALLESLDFATYSIAAYSDSAFDPRRKPESYAEALAEVGRAPARSKAFLDEEHQRRTREAYECLVDRELINPVLEQAAKAGDHGLATGSIDLR